MHLTAGDLIAAAIGVCGMGAWWVDRALGRIAEGKRQAARGAQEASERAELVTKLAELTLQMGKFRQFVTRSIKREVEVVTRLRDLDELRRSHHELREEVAALKAADAEAHAFGREALQRLERGQENLQAQVQNLTPGAGVFAEIIGPRRHAPAGDS